MKHPQYYDTTPEIRKRMGKVKLKNGDAEKLLAKELWKKGFRYRKNYRGLPESPDIAILKYHIAIFVDGEFWHGYEWGEKKKKLKRNREYWIAKIEENIARDVRVDKELMALGWIPIHFWTKEVIKNTNDCVKAVSELAFDIMLQETDE